MIFPAQRYNQYFLNNGRHPNFWMLRKTKIQLGD